jgi:hypothetical protein
MTENKQVVDYSLARLLQTHLNFGRGGTTMPKPARYLLQLRLTDSARRRIKSLAAKQGLTLQDAVVEAFDAWAEKLRADKSAGAQARKPNQSAIPISEPGPEPASWAWLKRALRLNWGNCPEVELLEDGVNRMWVLQDTDAPLTEVLRAIADGEPVPQIAEIFGLEMSQLAEVVKFAAAATDPTR